MKILSQIYQHIPGTRLIGAFLRLVRYPNLLFIFLTQYLLQYAVVVPVFNWYNIQPALSGGWFFILSFSTVLVAAAGYIINDYCDLEIDIINKPKKVVVGNLISRNWVYKWYWMLNISGVSLGFLTAWHIGYPMLGFTQFCCSGLLWFYSTAYKRQLLIGNVVVSLLTALTILIVGFYEPKLYKEITIFNAGAVYLLLRVILLYGVFAFLISIIRELVKDLEDREGDSRAGCRTVAIVFGERISKYIIFTFIFLLILTIFLVQCKIWALHWYARAGYFLLFIQIPLIWTGIKLKNADSRKAYHRLSRIIKWIMLAGILSMLFLIKK